ncbi:olfactory receptor 11H4-like [Pseudophryne corroboree]|uniref:olfactory receptor 11H4-like n=1 Tax=Pseudophryne corroboree TaxID=495146 RepID=UPI0030821234
MKSNKTVVKDFILLAFADLHQIKSLLIFVFLLTYITCIIGNFAIIILVRLEPSLHTVMYFFIRTFSILEIMFVTVSVPKLLANLIAADNVISFNACFTQMYVFISLGVTECYLLIVMAFDRYLAINNPLRYPAIMTPIFSMNLALLPWIIGFVMTLIPVIITARLEFCGSNMIDHFFCDLAPVQSLACSDPLISIIATSTATVFNAVVSCSTITGCYVHIIMTVSNIKSKEGRQKAFSTCSSHLIVTGLFYGSALIVYAKPMGSFYNKYLSFTYTVFTPMSNPFIYAFRNRDVRKALKNSRNYLRKPRSL